MLPARAAELKHKTNLLLYFDFMPRSLLTAKNTTSHPTERPEILPGTRLLVPGERPRLLQVGANKICKGRPVGAGDVRVSGPWPPEARSYGTADVAT